LRASPDGGGVRRTGRRADRIPLRPTTREQKEVATEPIVCDKNSLLSQQLPGNGRLMKTLRDLPSVSALLTAAESSPLHQRFGRRAATEALRTALNGAREAIKRGA